MEFSKLFEYLNLLDLNNNREWFNQNKEIYLSIKKEFDTFIDKLIPQIKEIDPSIGLLTAKECVFRIYRDIRFSHNKIPYKTHFGAYIADGGKKSKMTGYYIHIQPGQSFIAAGAYQPMPAVLKEIRYEIFENIELFNTLINNPDFIKYYSNIAGEKGKMVPKGFPKEFNDIEIIKYKSYEIMHQLSDDSVLSNNFEGLLLKAIKVAKPFNNFLNKAIHNGLEEDYN